MLVEVTGIIGDIKRLPASVEPHLCPCVHRDMLGIIAVNVAADVARRDLQRATAGEEDVRVILADAFCPGKGIRGRVLYLRGSR